MICTIRIPDVLQARIDAEAGRGGRSDWILEACRMRLDSSDKGTVQSPPPVGDVSEKTGNMVAGSSRRADLGSQPKATPNGDVAQMVRAPEAVVPIVKETVAAQPEVVDSNPTVSTMQALLDICAGKGLTYALGLEKLAYPGPLFNIADGPSFDSGPSEVIGRAKISKVDADRGEISFSPEVPICGKTWWEDGVQYECLMDAGHREQKHGLRGMVRVLD